VYCGINHIDIQVQKIMAIVVKNVYGKSKSKYGSKKTLYNGIKFDSQKELAHYLLLKEQEQFGIITELKCQVPFEIVPKQKGERSAHYYADFTYYIDGQHYICDVKGFRTAEYILKRKLVKLQNPNSIFIEV
jgi:hypothetical protein